MKFFLLIFLAGLSLAAARSVLPASLSADGAVALADKEPTAELCNVLRQHLDDILDTIKDIIDNGKVYKDDLVEKAKQIVDKLRDMKVDMSEHAKNVIADLKSKAKDYWKKVLGNLGLSSAPVHMEEPKTELGKKLKKHLEEILEKIRDIVDNGKTYKDDLIEKAKDISQKLKDMKVDIGDYARNVINEVKGKANDYWKKILDKLTFNSETNMVQHGVIGDYFNKVKDFFNDLNIELHEKYSQFGHWIKEQYEKNLEKGKDKAESLKQIAREFLHDSRTMSKHMAVEAKFFFNEYSHEIGDLFGDVMKKIGKVLES